jgi:hypothetical protein
VYAEIRSTITERMSDDASWADGPTALPRKAKEEPAKQESAKSKEL